MQTVRILGVLLILNAAASFDFTFAKWNKVLREHVQTNGNRAGIPLHEVDYTGVASSKDFSDFLQELKGAPVDQINMNKNLTYAFWMNVYNAFAVNMVVRHPCRPDVFGSCAPLRGIRDIGTFLKPVWQMNAGEVGGKQYSLDDIEVDILRHPPAPMEEDSRLHACIVCASISCPDLRNEAYVPDRLDEQMSDNLASFLANNKKGLALDQSTKTLTLSRIFDWFAGDFKPAPVDFILPHVRDPATKAFITAHKGELSLAYFGYNWETNGDAPPCSASRPCMPLRAFIPTMAAVLLVCCCSVGCFVYSRRRRRESGFVINQYQAM